MLTKCLCLAHVWPHQRSPHVCSLQGLELPAQLSLLPSEIKLKLGAIKAGLILCTVRQKELMFPGIVQSIYFQCIFFKWPGWVCACEKMR